MKCLLFGIPISALLYFSIQCYFELHGGTPWGKHSYQLEVENYLATTYPNLKTQIESVNYSFIEMRYTAHVSTTNELNFYVEEGYRGIWDNYPQALWAEEATKICTAFLSIHRTNAKCDVGLDGSGGINDIPNPIPNYEEVQEQLYSSLEVNVRFNIKLAGTETDYIEILELKKLLEAAKISQQISFLYDDVAFFDISTQIDTIQELQKKAFKRLTPSGYSTTRKHKPNP